MTALTSRPRFNPSPLFDLPPTNVSPPVLQVASVDAVSPWSPIVQCPAPFPETSFEIALLSLLRQPEQNSTLILRAEILSDIPYDFSADDRPVSSPQLDNGLRITRVIVRTLVPRRPTRDSAVTQICTFYSNSEHNSQPCCVVLTPVIEARGLLPFYHPPVQHLAFRFLNESLRIEAVPLSSDSPLTLESRLYRTSLVLLETVHRYCFGAVTNWQKRVRHDILVPREQFQDLYLTMRGRYQNLVQDWVEETDPQKHCYEELAIACYLMLLWKDTYVHGEGAVVEGSEPTLSEPWKSWPRPPAFLDLGCGAGLLTHILISEGYTGKGIDLQSRKSWAAYPDESARHLHVHKLDPTGVIAESSWESASYFSPGVFLIGNHADELTPWVPILAAFTPASGYLSIPCCTWAFEGKFKRSEPPVLPSTADMLDISLLSLPGSSSCDPATNDRSAYEAYRIFLGRLSLVCGFEIEADNLRIPSSRNWAIVGRQRRQSRSVLEDIRKIVIGVCAGGGFVSRSSCR
ncbi:hypothetical protein BKA62DRAFT_683928 [Auriculariales sp. MPI-PUGE-AT-0066]|nr:hypothetical protein BKA62DRAFT_683928 [Auriculariales sp. MPI-PUGE-AT-0066]